MDNDIKNSKLLDLHVEIWFMVTAHPLPKGTLWVRNKSDWAKGKEQFYGQVMSDRQSDWFLYMSTEHFQNGALTKDKLKFKPDKNENHTFPCCGYPHHSSSYSSRSCKQDTRFMENSFLTLMASGIYWYA